MYFVIVGVCNSIILWKSLYYVITKLLELKFHRLCDWKVCCNFDGQVLILTFMLVKQCSIMYVYVPRSSHLLLNSCFTSSLCIVNPSRIFFYVSNPYRILHVAFNPCRIYICDWNPYRFSYITFSMHLSIDFPSKIFLLKTPFEGFKMFPRSCNAKPNNATIFGEWIVKSAHIFLTVNSEFQGCPKWSIWPMATFFDLDKSDN